jgi:hypothetical protein
MTTCPALPAALAIMQPGDEVLVLSNAPQLLVFADRPSAGLCYVYLRGIFDAPAWRRDMSHGLPRGRRRWW